MSSPFTGSSGFLPFSVLPTSADKISGLLNLWLPLHPRNFTISVCGGSNFIAWKHSVQDDPVMMVELLFQKQTAGVFSLQQNTRENSAWYHSICKPRNINFSTTCLHTEFPKAKGYELQSLPWFSPHSTEILSQHRSSRCSPFMTRMESVSFKRKFFKKKSQTKNLCKGCCLFSGSEVTKATGILGIFTTLPGTREAAGNSVSVTV